MTDHPPGPPPAPRCPECDYHPLNGHAGGCERGRLQALRWARVHVVETALCEAIRKRREDDAFMERLSERVKSDKAILDKLAEV